MAMKIRLARGGSKKRPFYRIVAADSRMPRDGRFIEKLGTYNPLLPKDSEERVKMDAERMAIGKALGLDEKWAYNIVKQVGNYGEIYERNVGPNTPLGLERGLNALWTEGGIMYAAPFR